jgi:hypothetical protein
MILPALLNASFLFLPSSAMSSFSVLEESIIAYNVAHHQKMLSNGSYRGEEGILLLRPEIARSFGLTVSVHRDYLSGKTLFKKSAQIFESLKAALITQNSEMRSSESEQRIARLALDYNSTLRSAREAMRAYHQKLEPSVDDRLNKDICTDLLEKLLRESAEHASCNLRETLAFFYNRCQKPNKSQESLKVENVRFVNYVVHEFKQKSRGNRVFWLKSDTQVPKTGTAFPDRYKRVLGEAESYYIPIIESVMKQRNPAEYSVDLLLFLALIRQESNFNPLAVSRVGAVGLTQIMPSTAKALGMEHVFVPSYLTEAESTMQKERSLRRRALRLIPKITPQNCLQTARLARNLMQQSLKYKKKRVELYGRYRTEILENKTDDRLEPQKAIAYGLKYFDRLMAEQKGDVSLALAAYNAGSRRVQKYNGIPPYRETIRFRNRVLKCYREYLGKVDIHPKTCPRTLKEAAFAGDRQPPEIPEREAEVRDLRQAF